MIASTQVPSPPSPGVDPSAAAGVAIAAILCLVGPVLVGLWWRRRTGASLTAFGAGAFVFFVSQILLRLPWQLPLARWVVAKHGAWLVPFLLFSALTAALFEETGRWLGYRYLIRERSRPIGVMFGLGHGALEAMLLVGVPLAGLLIAWFLVPHESLPPAALEAIQQQMARISFWNAQLAALERASAMALHVGLALIVLQTWTRGGARWVLLAMAAHFGVNALAAALIQVARMDTWAVELAIAAGGIGVLATGCRLAAQGNRAA